MVGGIIVLGAVAILVVLNVIGAGRLALGFGLAFFLLVWPLFFLAVAPLPKPGLDPLTGNYTVKQRPTDGSGPDRRESDET